MAALAPIPKLPSAPCASRACCFGRVRPLSSAYYLFALRSSYYRSSRLSVFSILSLLLPYSVGSSVQAPASLFLLLAPSPACARCAPPFTAALCAPRRLYGRDLSIGLRFCESARSESMAPALLVIRLLLSELVSASVARSWRA